MNRVANMAGRTKEETQAKAEKVEKAQWWHTRPGRWVLILYSWCFLGRALVGLDGASFDLVVFLDPLITLAININS
jgi:hypothetical protein